MKYVLTINSDDPNEIVLLLGGLKASTPIISAASLIQSAFPMPVAAQEPDEPAAAPGVSFPGVDIHGLPWDARIHAGTGAKNSDGSWRGRRGLDVNVKTQVEAELRKVGAMPAAPIPAAPVPMPVAAAAIPFPVAAGAIPFPVAAAPAPVIPPMPVAAPVAAVPQPIAPAPIVAPAPVETAPAVATVAVDFTFVLAAINRGVQAGVIDAGYVGSLGTALGVADMSHIANDAAKCWQAYEKLVADGKYIAG